MKQAVFDTVTIDSDASASRDVKIKPEQMDTLKLKGIAKRGSSETKYEAKWKDDQGNVIYTEELEATVSAGTEHTSDTAARSHKAEIVITDTGSGSGDVDGIFTLV